MIGKARVATAACAFSVYANCYNSDNGAQMPSGAGVLGTLEALRGQEDPRAQLGSPGIKCFDIFSITLPATWYGLSVN